MKIIQTWYGTDGVKTDIAVQYIECCSPELINELLEETQENANDEEGWALEIYDNNNKLVFQKSSFSD